jgi:hypothetical protein
MCLIMPEIVCITSQFQPLIIVLLYNNAGTIPLYVKVFCKPEVRIVKLRILEFAYNQTDYHNGLAV